MELKENKEEYYAIEFESIFIDEILVIYYPMRVLKGRKIYDEETDKQYFQDELDICYVDMDLDYLLDEQITSGLVGYTISEKDLQKKYREVGMVEAKKQYYNEFKGQVYFGYRSKDSTLEKLEIKTLEVEDLIQFTSGPKSEKTNSNIALMENSVSQQSQNQTYARLMTLGEMSKILNSETLEMMKEKLEQIYFDTKIRAQFIESGETSMSKVFEEGITVNANIIENFYKGYKSSLMEIRDIQVLYQLIDEFDECLIALTLLLEKKKIEKNRKDFPFSDDVLSTLSDCCTNWKKEEDIDSLQKKIERDMSCLEEEFITLAQEYNQLLQEKSSKNEIKNNIPKELHPAKIYEFLSQTVIGQHEAKNAVISIMVRNELLKGSENKNVCLLIGPTGSGKTLIVETISKYFDKPSVSIDMTQLTKQGYKGRNPEDFLSMLLIKAKGDKKKAEEGIVIFDEIDKIRLSGSDKDWGKSIIDMLLSFISGTTYQIKYKDEEVYFDTARLSIFATGSYEEMIKKMTKQDVSRYKSTEIGFIKEQPKKEKTEDIIYPKITDEDLRKYGNIPRELLGRIPMIVQLKGHTKETLKRIITESNLSVLVEEVKIFQMFSVELLYNDNYLEEVAKMALKEGKGARSLKKIIEFSIQEARIEMMNHYFEGKMYKSVLLTEKAVHDSTECIFENLDGSFQTLKELKNQDAQVKIEIERQKKIGVYN